MENKSIIKFAVWGIGIRGKRAVKDLGHKVECIIENNSEYFNTYYENIPIISCDEYLESYSQCPVIITPFGFESEIKAMLIERGITNIFIYYECQDLIRAFALKEPVSNYIKNCNIDKIVIYTKEILGCLLYNYLLEEGLLRDTQTILENVSNQEDVMVMEELEKFYKECYRAIMSKLSDFYYNSDLERFRDLHRGERCFVVATGPSLKLEDLDKLHKNKETCFSVNDIFLLFDKTRWRPDYYVVSDLKAAQRWEKELFSEKLKAKFIAIWAGSESILEKIEHEENVYKWYAFKDRTEKGKPYFSDDFARGTANGWTVTYNVLQLAVYMGFSEIYLLGTDCNYKKGSQNNHFFEEKKKDMLDHNENGMILSYQAAQDYAKAHGIKIYNATRGGMLEVFERVDFDSLFE